MRKRIFKLDDRYTDPYPIPCCFCWHFKRNGKCKAFTKIPMKIWDGSCAHNCITKDQQRRGNDYVFKLNPRHKYTAACKHLAHLDRLPQAQ